MGLIEPDSNYSGLRVTAILLCAGILTAMTGCTYSEPAPDDQYLLLMLGDSASGSDYFCYELSSSILISYLTGFGKYQYTENIASAGNNVVLTMPLVPMRPVACVVQARLQDAIQGEGYLVISCNETELGHMKVTRESERQMFVFEKDVWAPDINIFKMQSLKSGPEIEIEGLFLLKSKDVLWREYPLDNHFVGLVAYKKGNSWDEAVYIPSKMNLKIPVLLPDKNVYWGAELMGGTSEQIHLNIQLETARSFGRTSKQASQIIFKNADQWVPVSWDISEFSERHIMMTLENGGDNGVLLREMTVTRIPGTIEEK